MRLAWPNLGAEEGEAPVAARRAPGTPVGRLVERWQDLVADPPWPWLRVAEGLVPWLATPAAAAEAAGRTLPLWGPDPEVVRRVHDKAYAAQLARSLDDIGPLLVVLDAAACTVGRVEQEVARWPAWAQHSFTVKPRWGTSGRGRTAGVDGRLRGRDAAPEAVLGVAARGGAVVEPWLARTVDLSSQWFVDEAGTPQLLGVTRQLTRGAGVYLGCDVVRTAAGFGSGTDHDEALVARARVVVGAAAAAGFRGPCGVDAFVYTDHTGTPSLRGVVELNARFTAGQVALGMMVRRVESGGFAVGQRATFRLDRDDVLAVE